MKAFLLLSFFIACLSVQGQNSPPTLSGHSQVVPYGQLACIDIETSDADGDSVFIGLVTQIPQSIFTQNNSFKKFASGQICVTPARGIHSDYLLNTTVVYATDRKDTTYRTFWIEIPRYPNTVRPHIEKQNFSTFKIDVKGDRMEPWEDYKGLKYQSKVFDKNNNLLLTDTNQVFTFTASSYEVYVLYVVYKTSIPMVYVTRDTLYPDMNVGIDNAENTGFSIYPNPATNTLYLQSLPQQAITMQVYDITGKQTKIAIHNNTADISQLSNGLYYVVLTGKEGAVLAKQRFIKSSR